MRHLWIVLPLALAGCAESENSGTPESSPVADEAAADVKTTDASTSTDLALAKRAGAPLFDGMGSYQMAITTTSPEAQRYFNQGMVLAFAFNHAESVRSFRAAQSLDPDCAMCFWGEALATGPNINVTSNGKAIMSPDDRIKAFEVSRKAASLMVSASEREQAYIKALMTRYNGDVSTDRFPLDVAYAEAMAEVAARYPDDLDAASLYAEALMNTMPWNYWVDDVNPRPDTVKVIDNLERVLAADPEHPLALHLYIHAVEASGNPGRAEVAADTLADLVPGAGHLVHMPAHIYWRVGRYHDASEANIRAAKVDEAYIAQCNAQGFYPALYYPHNIHFLWAASTMQGRSALSIESALKVASNVNLEQIAQFPTVEYFKTIPLLSYVRFGKWEEILSEPEPPENLSYSQGIRHYARGVALTHAGDLEAARAELQAIAPLRASSSVVFMDERSYPASTLLSIAESLLAGEIALADEQFDEAVSAYERAVALQDELPYTEPPFWYYPTRQSLGNAMMKAGRFEDAIRVYEKDLKDYPKNGWSMFGLAQALQATGDTQASQAMMERFAIVWQMADVELEASVFE